ncbi:MAG: hypothetical protein IJ661_03820 [Lachnospiraceae bacterium]|nr:hypothetical protein [Lachnospiraceae bacterium]
MFEMKRTVTYSQVGSNITMDMAGIVHYLQDCTLAHSESVGRGIEHVAGTKRAWFLSSWQIEVIRFPEYQEHVTVRTWPHDFKSLYGYRNFDILDNTGAQLVRANSIWIFMDLSRMMPMKPSEEDMKGYDIEPAIDMEYAPRKIKQLGEEYRVEEKKPPYDKNLTAVNNSSGIYVKKSFLDSNNHVNNGRYVSEALDLIDVGDIKKMRVDYRKAAVLGDVMYPVVYMNDGITQVVLNDPEGSPYVLVEITE